MRTIYVVEEGSETLRGRADGLMFDPSFPDLRGLNIKQINFNYSEKHRVPLEQRYDWGL